MYSEMKAYNYGDDHKMKPLRLDMTYSLITSYRLNEKMSKLHCETVIDKEILTSFHTKEYVDYLYQVGFHSKHLEKYGFNVDCPPFNGVFDYSSKIADGSLNCAKMINEKSVDVAIDWAGGLHHCRPSFASGFCYINDIVLAILALLKKYKRVLYIDIDVHHGDGVENAFKQSNRVFTLSFHRFGENFFPGSGKLEDIGSHEGKYYSVNFPLCAGINDDDYSFIFNQVLDKVNEHFRAEVIVLQCGADSLAGDELGDFNLTSHGHGACIKKVLGLNIPVVLLGGGGYNVVKPRDQ
jgi:acetoin utilization deacetylase AcuC-like enzyme